MSQIGKKPISIPDNVTVGIKRNMITVSGGLGELKWETYHGINVNVDGDNILVTRTSDIKKLRELHGLVRALIANMVTGVSVGFTKTLKLIGVGYTADFKGDYVILNLGYSHAIYFGIPDGVTVEIPKATTIVIKGIDKQKVGQVAAKIRSYRPPEPYKGKGIRYIDEHVRRKAGKTVAAIE